MGDSFSKVDLSHAYLQLQLEDSAKDYLVINTHKGLFKYTQMPFGITSAPAIFQRTVDNLLQGLKHVRIYIDETLDEVLTWLEKAGMLLKRDKCAFMSLPWASDEQGWVTTDC